MMFAGVDAGVNYGRTMLASELRYAPMYNKMESFGLKFGTCAWLDVDKNEALYIILGASKDKWHFTEKEYNKIHPIAVIRWQCYNGFWDIGYQNAGIVFTVGYSFRRINW